MIHQLSSFYIFYTKLFLIFIATAAVVAIFCINKSQAQESGAYITSSYIGAQYYYPVECDLWEILPESSIVMFDSLEELLQEHDDKELHSGCADEPVSELEESQNFQELLVTTPFLEIQDGDLIQAIGDIDVYIVKIVGNKRFKRLILNPTIFDSYDHLDWENIKIVSRQTLALYTTSNLVQEINPDGEIADPRVFQLFPEGDTGMKRHVALTPEEFNAAGGDWDSVYYINYMEAGEDFYITETPMNDMQEFRGILQEQEPEIEDGTILNPNPAPGSPITSLPPPTGPVFIVPGPEDSSPDSVGPLTPVGNIVFDRVQDTQINLAWTPVPGATGYDVYYEAQGPDFGISSNANINTNVVVADTTATVTGLVANTEYMFRVRGKNSEEEGPWSEEKMESTLLINVGFLTFGTTTENTINLRWDATIGARGYDVQYKAGNGNYIETAVILPEAQITGLTQGTTYTFRVRGRNGDDVGVWSGEQTHSTQSTLLTPVGNITFGATTANKINLSWSSVAGAASYDVQYKTGAESYSSANVTVTLTTATVTDLTPSTEYTFRARAARTNILPHKGPWSAQVKHSTKLATVGTLTFGATTDTSINLSWDAITGAESYDVEYKTGQENYIRKNVTTPDATITGLEANTTYTFRVRAKNASGEGARSDEQTHSTKLATVGTLTFGATTDTEVQLSWESIEGATLYDLNYKVKGSLDATYSRERVTIIGTSATVTGLSPNTSYTFKARGKNANSVGAWSGQQTHSTLLARVGTITFAPSSDTKINLSWDAITGAEDYDLRYKIKDAADSTYSRANVTVTGSSAAVTGLVPNTKYTFRVRAMSVDNVGVWSNQHTHSTKLARVDALTFGSTTDTTTRLSWDATIGATIYDIEYKTGQDSWSRIEATTTEARITGLTANTTYNFRVRARNLENEGAWSSEQTHSTKLANVAGLVFGATTDVGINLSWSEVVGATSYEVQHKTSSSDWTSTSATNPEATITGLTPNTEYTFKVRAKTLSNTGAWSQSQNHPTRLATIADFTFGTTTDTEIQLSWEAITGADDYEVQYKTGSGNYSDTNVTVTGTTATITGLTPDTSYTFRLRALRTLISPYEGLWSNTETHRTLLSTGGVLTFGRTTQSKINLSWDAITGADDYEIQYKTGIENWTSTTSTNTRVTITELAPNTGYTFRLRARNNEGQGEWSRSQTHKTILATVGVITFGTTTQSQINLSWEAISGATLYDVEYKAGNGSYSSTNVTITDNTATVEGLNANTNYTFRVRAKNSEGQGDWSNSQDHLTRLARIGTLTFAPSTDTEIQLSWNAITGADGYKVQYKTGGGSYTDANVTITGTTATITGLTSNTVYTFKARATNANGQGAWSNEQTHSTRLAKVGVLSFGTTKASEISLSWGEITGATSYEVQHKTSSSDWTSTLATNPEATVTGLTPNTEYTFRVRAKTLSNTGAWSQSQNHSTRLATVGTITFGTTTDTSISLGWGAVTGGASYEVEYKTGAGNYSSDNVTITGTTAIVTGLTANTVYTFKVKARNSSGQGAWSNEQTHQTLLAPVNTLTFGTITDTSVSLSWEAVSGAYDYEVQYKAGSANYSDSNVEITGTTATVTSLNTATEYTFRVRAVRSSPRPYEGAWSNEQTYSTRLATVGNITFGTTTDTSTRLSWAIIAGAASYEVEYKTGSGSYSDANVTVIGSTASVTNLTPATSYTFRVRAARTSTLPYKGAWSNEQTYSTLLEAIDTLSLDTITNTQANLSWSAIAGAAGYDVEYKTADGNYTDANVTVTGTTASITDLTPNTSYTFRVRAKNVNILGAWPEEQNHSTLLTTIGDLTFGTTTDTEINLSWTAVTEADGYDLEYKIGSGNWTSETVTNPEAQLTNLEPGTTYTFRVRAKASDVLGPWSPEQDHSTSLGKVGTLNFASSTASQINLSWDAINGASSYEVEYKTGNGSYSSTGVTVTGTTAAITGLDSGTTYTFRVRATSSSGQGAWSEEVDHATTLARVGTLTFGTTTASQINLSWDAVSGAASYEVEYKAGGGSYSSTNVTITDNTASITSLTSATEYTFRVRATNAGGEGAWSLEQNHSTLFEAVDGLALETRTNTQINLSWNTLTGAAGYEVEYKTGSGSYSNANVTITGTAATVTGLNDGTEYIFRVRAVNGEWSTEQSYSTLLLARVGTITFGATTDTEIQLSWDAISSAITYDVEYKTGAENWLDIASINSEVQVTGLNANTEYTFRVRAKNSSGIGAWSLEQTHSTLLAATEYFDENDKTNTQISLEWDAVAGAANYEVQYKLKNAEDSTYSSTNVTIAGTTANITNLSPDTKYTFRLRAVGGVWSEEQDHRTLLLDRVGTLTFGITTDTEIQLSWEAVTDAERYDIFYENIETRTTGSVRGFRGTTVTITNLAPGSVYKFLVRALGSEDNKTGALSHAQTHSTLLLAAVGNLAFTSTDTNINLSWDAVTGATGYEVEYKTGAGSYSSDNVTVTLTTAAITGLTEGTEYTFRVRATSVGEEGAWSTEQNYSTLLTKVGTLTFGTTTDTSTNLSWEAVTGSTGYDLEYKASDGIYSDANVTITGTTASVADLTPGTTYTFRARAKSSDVTGEWSEEQTHSTLLSKVGTLTFASSTDTSINLSWDAISNSTGYEVEYKTADGNYSSDNVTITLTTASITGLTTATEYTFRVRATSASNAGAWSEEQTHSTLTKLARVGAITVSAESQTVTLSWDEILPASGYAVQYKKTDETNWQDSSGAITGQTTKTTTIENLDLASEYEFRAKATGDNTTYVNGEWSEPTTPITILSKVGTLTFGTTTDTSTNLSWEAVTSATGYDVEYKTGSGSYSSTNVTVTGTTAQITGLTPNTEYTFRVKATSASNTGVWSEEQTHSTLLETISGILPYGKTDTRISFDWGAIAGATGYDVEYKTGSGNWVDTNVTITDTGAVVTGLTINTTYQFRVRARNGNVVGSWSQEVSISTMSLATINTLRFGEITDTTINLSWDAVATATSYDIWYETGGRTTTKNVTSTTATITGLTPNTTYSFLVRAERGNYEGPFQIQPSIRSTLLEAVGTLTFDETTNTSISLSWDPTIGATTYEVEYKTGAGNYSSNNVTITGTTAQITGLTPNTEYTFRVRALGGAWSEEQTHSTQAPSGPPSPPGNPNLGRVGTLTFAPSTQSEINLSWDAIEGAETYEVEYKAGRGGYKSDNVTITNTSANVTDLTSGREYTFRVRAKNGNHHGPWSTKQTHSTQTGSPSSQDNPSLGRVGTLTFGTTTASEINLSWDAVTDATDYEVEYKIDSGNYSSTGVTITRTTAQITSLTSGTEYTFRVRATNVDGEGEWSQEQTHSTQIASQSLPDNPSLGRVDTLTFGTTTDTIIDLSWEAINGATGYEVEYKIDSGNYSDANVTITGTTAAITGLTPATEYTFRVRATDSDREGEWSQEQTHSTLLSKVGTLTFGTTTDTTIDLSWDAIAGATGYEVEYKIDSGNYSNTNVTITLTTASITGLTTATEYTFKVRALGGVWSEEQVHSTRIALSSLPDNPSLGRVGTLTFGTTTGTSINLSWDAITDATSYNVEYKAGSGSYSSTNVTITGTTATVTNITSGTTYTFRVRAINVDGGGEWSGEQTHSTLTLPQVARVGAVTVSAEGSTVTLTWSGIQNSSGYSVQYKKTAQTNWQDSSGTITGGARKGTVIENLDLGSEYEFRVKATGDGTNYANGEWSEPTDPIALLARVGRITFGKTTHSEINFSWRAIEGATYYSIQYYKTSDGIRLSAGLRGTTPRFTRLDSGTEYAFRIRARNENVYGEWSDLQTHSTKLERVGTLTFAPSTASEISLSWDTVTRATGYDVEYKVENAPDNTYSDANVTVTLATANVTGLTDNTTYAFRVRARNSGGKGSWSQPQTHLTGIASVGTLTFESSTDSEINLSWDAISGATSYDVEYKTGSGSYSSDNVTVTGTTATITGLSANTEYTFRVRVRSGDILVAWSPEQTHSTLLSPVGTLTFASSTDSQISLSWDAISSATLYDVEYKTGRGSYSSDNLTITGLTATVTGLTSGTTYTFRVRAKDTSNTGVWSPEQDHKTLLSPVGTLTFAPSTASQINLSWDAISGATGYDVEYKADSGNYSSTNVTITDTTAAVTGLAAATEYTFRVRATNSGEEGEWSQSQTHSTLLSPVGTLTFASSTDSQISLSWDAISSATGYDLEYKVKHEAYTTYSDTNVTVTGTTATVTDLAMSTIYTFRVRARSSDREGEWSQEQDHSTLIRLERVGSILHGVKTDTEINIIWNVISGATGYDVEYKVKDAADTTYSGTNVTITSVYYIPGAQITGLTAATDYTFRVRAKNGDIVGEWSEGQDHKTLLSPVGTLTFAPSTGTSISLSWDAVTGATSYEVEYKAGSGSYSSTNVTITGESANITGLTTATEYTFRVRAVGGVWSEEQTHSTLLSPVGTLTFAPSTASQINLSWDAIANATGYEVEYKKGNGSYSSDNVTITGTTATVTGLSAATEYTFRVRAVGGVWSEEQNHSTSASSQLRRLDNISVSAEGSTVTLSWGEIQNSVGYSVQHKKTTQTNWQYSVVIIDGDATKTAAVENLDLGSEYEFRVKAVGDGVNYLSGEWSEPTNSITLLERIDTFNFGFTNTSEINLSWRAIRGAVQYHIQYYKTTEGIGTGIIVWAGSTTPRIARLTSGTEYTFRVRAKNGDSYGEWSRSQTHRTLLARVGNLTFDEATDTTINLSWNATPGADEYKVEYKTGSSPWTLVTVSDTQASIINLTPDTEYTFRVRARNSSGEGPWSTTQTHSTSLMKVGTLTLLISTNTIISLSWDAIEGATGYEIEYKTGSGNYTNINTSVIGTTATITGLVTGTQYTFRVRLISSQEIGAWSEEYNYSTSLARVGTLTFAPSTDSQINLNWDAIDGSDLYEVEYKAGRGSYSSDNVTVTGTTATVTNLDSDTTYTFRVRAKNAVAEGEWSSEQTRSTLPQLGRVGTISSSANTDTQINISWSVLSDAAAYDVEYKLKDAEDTTYSSANVVVTRILNIAGAKITGLNVNTTYTFRVRGRNGDFVGEWSRAQDHSTLLMSVGALTFAPSTDSQINLSWSAMSGATGYNVEYKTGGGRYSSDNVTITGTTARVTGLSAATSYTFRVRSRSANNVGAWSLEQDHKTTLARVGALTFGARTISQINLEWVALSGATGYDVEYKTGGGSYSSANVTITGTSATVTSLTKNTAYTFRVRAKNENMIGEWSREATRSTLSLARVGALTFVTISNTQVGLIWEAIEGATTYDIEYKTGSGNYVDVNTTVTGTEGRVTGLNTDTEYTFRVKARNSKGSGEWSLEQTHSTATQLARVGTVRNGTITSTQIRIIWDSIEGANDYDVQYKVAGTPDSTYSSLNLGLSFGNNTSSATLNNLTPNTLYAIRVRARNGNAVGEWSPIAGYFTLP